MGLIEKATNTKGVQMNQQTRDELKKVEESHTLAPGDLSPIHSETGSDLDSDRKNLVDAAEDSQEMDAKLTQFCPYDPRKAPSFDRDHLKIVIADGNCGFRAIAHVISGDEEHHHFVRKKVCEFIEKKDDRWIRALTQRRESPIEYLNRTKMRESAIYMTEVELQAVAELLQAHIVCFGELWQRYNPDFPTNLRKLYTDSKLHDGRPVIALLLRNAHFYLIKKL
ncbi:hypothetical protein QR680_014660 [Steinernema hermaphroditum]|uniref:ubiquitinyl hydrolase 1 n=1 Tax=Steinernema hermaphroditum TaxID=289476 RepID=A0AA39IBB6_9BILA|nr:hypothetical protein QR680_014660 [Steinernema hermaphroditum]